MKWLLVLAAVLVLTSCSKSVPTPDGPETYHVPEAAWHFSGKPKSNPTPALVEVRGEFALSAVDLDGIRSDEVYAIDKGTRQFTLIVDNPQVEKLEVSSAPTGPYTAQTLEGGGAVVKLTLLTDIPTGKIGSPYGDPASDEPLAGRVLLEFRRGEQITKGEYTFAGLSPSRWFGKARIYWDHDGRAAFVTSMPGNNGDTVVFHRFE